MIVEVKTCGVCTSLKRARRPVTRGELLGALGIVKEEKKTFDGLIKALLTDGLVVQLKNHRYGIPREMNLLSGTLETIRSGAGYVIVSGSKDKDIYIPTHALAGALNGDKVVVRVEHTSRGRKEGKIIKVTTRKSKHVVGFIREQKGNFILQPEDDKIPHNFIVRKTGSGITLHEGLLAAAKITGYPEKGYLAECSVLKVFDGLKTVDDVSRFTEYKYSLPLRFKKRSEEEARLLDSVADLPGRKDLRNLRHVTIDGEFARDFDDAVCIEKKRDGYRLFISIADVSHFVRPDSSLDREACERGNSVYFPGTVVPMLPKKLSNIVCSLNPVEDRHGFTVEIDFSKSGEVRKTDFYPSVIRSIKRLTYREVESAMVPGNRTDRNRLESVITDLEVMGELAAILMSNKRARGSLDFDLPEPDFILDMEGGIANVFRTERFFSHCIIEEFMIAANEAVAGFLEKKQIPALFRNHEPPDREKLRDFDRLIQHLPIAKRKNKESINRSLQSVLEAAKDTDYEFFVNRILLRSMKQARYSSENRGHFGLASVSYLHFTSPIRRYPDLICHRILKAALGRGGRLYSGDELEKMSVHLSEQERYTMEAERELEGRLRVLFMGDKLGEVFQGIISHVTSFGIFVELSTIFVEGIVLLSDLHDDYYIYQEEHLKIIGRRTKKVYRIGDIVSVKVVVASAETNRLHFIFV